MAQTQLIKQMHHRHAALQMTLQTPKRRLTFENMLNVQLVYSY